MTPPSSNSTELLQYPFSQLAQFNAITSYPKESPAQCDDRSQYLATPQSGLPTPAPMYQGDMYSVTQPEYVYSQQGVGLGLPNEVYDFPQHVQSQNVSHYPPPPTQMVYIIQVADAYVC